MTPNSFADVASHEGGENWEKQIEREMPLYHRDNDIRSEYERDYTRILHSLAYRRLKHKTQVFFNIDNDHICTRMEHVQHVESVSCTIASYLGLNVELARAIAMGHDLGHAPFGHKGEVELTGIRKEFGFESFWHEQNSLRMIDCIELLEDNNRNYRNLNLTYAVRDGIISHCGEVDDRVLMPRKEKIDLGDFKKSGQFQAYTWEGCVVKISDKIAYLGRDIEDAVRMNFIGEKDINDLLKISNIYGEKTINTTVLIHNFITSICENSSPDEGIRLSDEYNDMLKAVKAFNYERIYRNPKFEVYRKYASLIIRSIFDTLINRYEGADTVKRLQELKDTYPSMITDFTEQIFCYSDIGPADVRYQNKKIYGKLESREIYAQAIIDYISGMTDRYAISIFNELLRY